MFERDRFIADCRAALAAEHPEAAVRDLVARAVSQPAAIEASLGSPRTGGFFTIYRSPELTVLNVVWTPDMAIYPHEHRMWAVIGLYGGQEDNTFYRRGAHGVVAAGGKRLERGDTALLGETIIHAVANPLRTFTGAIHVYGGDFFGAPRSEWTTDGLVERPFDPERARRVFVEANTRWEQAVLGQDREEDVL
jgi:predicted metal-dependent enzyme (double-stranded beta helix superfamily)